MKIKKGMTVQVIAGKDKSKIGKVIKVLRDADKVVVEGVNVVKRHKKPTANDDTRGIIEFEAPIHVSNVMAYDEKAKKRVRKVE